MADDSTPRFSLLAGEGAAALFGMAGGDIAGGSPLYSAPTQQATVVAYHLINHGGIDPATVASDLADLAGNDREASVYRHAGSEFKTWLTERRPGGDPTSEAAAWTVPVGVWWRRTPERLAGDAVNLAGLLSQHAPSLLTAAAVAAAAAASCYAQSGEDLIRATAELMETALVGLPGSALGIEEARDLSDRFRAATSLVGESPSAISDHFPPEGHTLALGAILLAAPAAADSYRLVEAGAIYGGSLAGSITGALVASRVGWQPWPWVVPNDTWFMEIGRRLAGSSDQIDDLPQPYAVEERLTAGDTESF